MNEKDKEGWILFFSVLGAIGVLGVIFEITYLFKFKRTDLFKVFHAPGFVSHRAGDFTVNICGIIGKRTKRLEYRLNRGPKKKVEQLAPYVPEPYFDIEIPAGNLLSKNNLEIIATPKTGDSKFQSFFFEYSKDEPPSLPLTVDWASKDFEVGHGYWESVKVDGEWRARSCPGHEEYDRILIISGAFEEARRIETYMVFRNHACPKNQYSYGFGILPLWGGRPDVETQFPKRGWKFSLAWYYSIRRAVGQEFSYKFGMETQDWIGLYRPFVLKPDVKNYLITETWPIEGANGLFKCYKQRMKWWQEGSPEPVEWMVLEDIQINPLEYGKYGIAFVCLYCQAEIGTVQISPLKKVGVPG